MGGSEITAHIFQWDSMVNELRGESIGNIFERFCKQIQNDHAMLSPTFTFTHTHTHTHTHTYAHMIRINIYTMEFPIMRLDECFIKLFFDILFACVEQTD